MYAGARGGTERSWRPGDEEKRAADEATFRETNERIRATERELGPPLERVPFVVLKQDGGGELARAVDPREEEV